MKKGFSLIELIISITIILLLSLLIFPSLIKINNETREKEYNAKIKVVLAAAREWGNDNLIELSSDCTYIFIRDLINLEYIKGDNANKTALVNPTNNESMNNMMICVTYEKVNNNYQIKSRMVKDEE